MQACNELVTTVKPKQFRYPKMQKYQNRSYRGGGGGGARGAAAPLPPPGPVELDSSSLWLNAPITKLTSVRRSLLNKEMFLSFIVAFEFRQFPRTALICIFAAGVARSG